MLKSKRCVALTALSKVISAFEEVADPFLIIKLFVREKSELLILIPPPWA